MLARVNQWRASGANCGSDGTFGPAPALAWNDPLTTAAGQTTINGVVDGWIASPGPCANIMKPAFVHVGVACINGTSSDTYPTYWTMELAKPF